MKHLFVARHGKYDSLYRLSEEGKRQIETLGIAIKETLNNGTAYIISSTAPRATESSQILASQLGLSGFENVPYLWTGADSEASPNYGFDFDINRSSNEVIMKVINNRKERADGLIVMAHLEFIQGFPLWFHIKEFGRQALFEEVEKGHALHFDLEHKTNQILPKTI